MKQPKYSCNVNFTIKHFFAKICFYFLVIFFSISKPIEEKEKARYVSPF